MADVIVNDTIIIELKSVKRIINAHVAQLVNYHVSIEKPISLILNFETRKIKAKRKFKDLN